MHDLKVLLFFLIYAVITVESKIVIIGAGATGIAAASRLLENGINDIVILEAENRTGGRIYAEKIGEDWVDLGAQWVHGEDENPVYKLAWPLGLLENSNENKSSFEFFNSAGEKPLTDEQTKNITDFFFKIEKSPQEYGTPNKIENMGDIYKREFKKYFQEHEDLFEHKQQLTYLFELILLSCDPGMSWNEVAVSHQWGFPGDHALNWKDKGYSLILDILMKKYPDPTKELPVLKKIKLKTKVSKIVYKDLNEKVKVHTEAGEIFEADHVIFTPSLGVLKSSHKTLFEPRLSQQKKHFIENFGYGSVTKIYLRFEEVWWNDTFFATNILWNDKDRQEKENNSDTKWQLDISGIVKVEHKPNLLCVWVVGKGAQQVEKLSMDDLCAQMCDILNILNKTHNISSDYQMIRSNWFSNDNFQGAYSFKTFEGLRNHVNITNFAEPISLDKPKILFAGEATDPRSYSSVHGAIASGWREADRLIKLYQNVTTS